MSHVVTGIAQRFAQTPMGKVTGAMIAYVKELLNAVGRFGSL